MVKIEGKSIEKVNLRNKVNVLEEITKRIVGDKRINRSNIFESFYIADAGIDILLDINYILVGRSKNYDLALNLADAYEKETKENWTLKKDY